MKLSCSFLESHANWAISAVVYVVAGSLVGKKVDVEVLLNCSFEQVNDVAVICDGNGFLSSDLLVSELEDFVDVVHDNINPALIVSRLDSGKVNFCEDTNSVSDVSSLWLSTTHAAKSG